MIDKIERRLCTGCNSCVNSCPNSCIKMKVDEGGFWFPIIDRKKCINCKLCENACPIINNLAPNIVRMPQTIAACCIDEITREKSSSGGVFSVIAEYVLRCGGVVIGAAFSDDFKHVSHICINSVDDLDKLRGSKYTQSFIGDVYRVTRKLLNDGKIVLFTGTPCQISGLFAYLGKSYNNLYTQDIICHGVSSPLVWEKYVDYRERMASSKTRAVHMRHKISGWKNFSMYFLFENGKRYLKRKNKDPFLDAYLSNCCLRPSCYNCLFKSVQRLADITLADFWGIQRVLPKMDDDRGTSLVLLHSSKGVELFNSIKEDLIYEEVDEESALRFNVAYDKCSESNASREAFLAEIDSVNFDVIVKRYTKISIRYRFNRLINRVGRKLNKIRNIQ